MWRYPRNKCPATRGGLCDTTKFGGRQGSDLFGCSASDQDTQAVDQPGSCGHAVILICPTHRDCPGPLPASIRLNAAKLWREGLYSAHEQMHRALKAPQRSLRPKLSEYSSRSSSFSCCHMLAGSYFSIAWLVKCGLSQERIEKASYLPRGTMVTLSTPSRWGTCPASSRCFLRMVAVNPFPTSYAVKRLSIFMRFGSPGRLMPCTPMHQ